ncbi:MAG: response regulator [Bacteroidetes bacterium]|jgi:CheY-like chemotaxis protein|nr:response regulator [Bacteroidota bacterium]
MKKSAILCVDDESIILDSLIEQLQKELGNNYIYETAESADEGLEVLEELVEEQIDVLIIVSDWLMPGIKGDEFLIKVHQRFPGIVKVMLTGQASQDAIDKAKEMADIHAVINKPWSEKELLETIKKGLAQ